MFSKKSTRHWDSIWLFLMTTVIVVSGYVASPAFADLSHLDRAKEMGATFSEVAKKSAPAVVSVRTEKTLSNRGTDREMPQDWFGNGFFEQFFGHDFSMPAPEQHVEGQGSGFIISRDGYILTNNHVVNGADKVLVQLSDGRELDAEVVGTDPPTDIAVIRIKAKDLPTLPLGDSDALEVGEWVLALGNPFGLSNTLTAGIVSAKGRSRIGITDYEDFIQTDAAINPGNSGGPLINLDGNVVGINTAIATRSGGYMGVGFAIPIRLAMEVERQIVDHGSVTRGYLGVVIQDLSPELAASMNVPDTKGILVSEVEDGSPADHAGLHVGDIIVDLDGKPVEAIEQLRNQVALTKPGGKVELTCLREGHSKSVSVEVGRSPQSRVAQVESSREDDLGFQVDDLTTSLAEQLHFEGRHGVIVTEVAPSSAAARAGIHARMLIEEVNRQPIKNVSDFRKAIAEAKGERLLLLVRDERDHFVVIPA